MTRLKKILLCLAPMIVCVAASAAAEEQRCKELGANCVCSEPFNTDKYEKVGSWWWNPADSTVKQCTNEQDNTPITRGRGDIQGSFDSVVLSALPDNHQVTYFLRASDGHVGKWTVGSNDLGSSKFIKRAAMRWYIYHSSNFEFAGDGVCENSKMARLTDLTIDKSFGGVHTYNFVSWTPSIDCCLVGPEPNRTNIGKQAWRGKWYRVEVVVTNRKGPGFDMEVYLKNITDNKSEIKVVDLLPEPCLNCDGSDGWPAPANLTPPGIQNKMLVNNYRQNACSGFIGISHYMLAGWDTNNGQRIGPAFEIESSTTTNPTPPQNLRIR